MAILADDGDGNRTRLALVDDYAPAVRPSNYWPLATGQANARLIAAAPALLEALRKLLASGDHTAAESTICPHCDAECDARAAIAAAETPA